MDKKTYIAPAMEVANIETVEMMATSGSVPFSVSAAISTKPVSFGYRCKVS